MLISYAVGNFHDGNLNILKSFKSTSVESILPEKKNMSLIYQEWIKNKWGN